MSDSPFISDANAETFSSLVLERSLQVPVLVDFWADWCEPCKMLMPVLSNLAEEYQGGFHLVKINTDQHPELAQHFGVRSLPTVKVFRNGEPVDEFMGVQPEPAIREMIDKYRTREMEGLRQQALEVYRSGDTDTAYTMMQEVVNAEPDYFEAVTELAGMAMQREELEQAEQLIAGLPEEQQQDEQVKAMLAQIQMIKMQAEAGDVEEIEQRLAANPEDLGIMIELANSRVAMGQHEEGMDMLLAVMKKDREFDDGAARKGLLKAFEALGGTNPLVKVYRNKMFSMLH